MIAQQQSMGCGMSPKERVDSFIKELGEFKVTLSNFDGKDPANFLPNLTVVKLTNAIEETFKKLNEEMKVTKFNGY